MQPNKQKRDQTIALRQQKEKNLLLEKFRKMPILQVALDKTGVSRTTYYRWRQEDFEFKKTADEAIGEGESYITELSESKLLSLINREHFPAVHLWLRTHHPKYANKIELSGSIALQEEVLTQEQQQTVNEALRLLSLAEATPDCLNNDANETDS